MSGLLATLAFGKVREHSTSLYTLVREQNRLSFVEKVTKENLQEFDQTQVKPIKDQLLGRLQTIRTQDFDQALFTIRQTIDEIVQPLSRNLDEQISQWSPPDFDLKESKIDWKKAARQAAIVKEIDPKIIPLIISLIGIPTIVSNYGIQIGTIILVQSVLTGYFLYLVTKKVFSKLANNTFGFVLSLLIAGFMQAALSLIWSYRIDSSLGILLIAPGAALVVGFLVAIVNTASRQLNEVRLNISQTTADLSWAVSRIRNEQHQRSRNLGRKLHGEIQARFSSAFLMLQNSQNNPETTKSLINEIADNLEKDVLKLDEPNSNVQKLDEVLDNVTQTWQGVSSISFVADETLKKQIERDKLCQTALVDVIPELCFNSIKHGKASEVMVSIEKSSPKTILLKVADNGQKVAEISNKGLGTKLLDECAISWKREKAKDLVVTSAEFAISA
jgi:signal transduction histidine kinase